MLRSSKHTRPQARRLEDTLEDTMVLFPRFEYEGGDLTKRYSEREVVYRAEDRNWLPGVEVELLLNPLAVAHSANVQYRSGGDFDRHSGREGLPLAADAQPRVWWGIYHVAKRRLTLGRLFQSPFTGSTHLYRSWISEHDYLWDSQSIGDTRHELVLERLRVNEPVFDEVMAIMTPGRWSQKLQGTQQVVMKNTEGEWAEPQFGEDFPERDFNFAILQALATREGLAALPTPQLA